VSARIRTLLETQKRLQSDLTRAKELQQQRNGQRQQQQQGAAAAAADRSQATAGAASDMDVGARTPRAGSSDDAGSSSSSSSESHDTYVARLSELLDSSAPKVEHLQQQLEDVITKFRWIAEYYSEDVKGQAWRQQPVSFLTHFLELLDSIAATMKDSARLARVTSMLAEYVETQKSWHQQEAEQQQQQALQQEMVAAEAQAMQQAAEEDEEEELRQALLQQQQQLLREHAANELLWHKTGTRASSSSSSSSNDDGEDDEQQQQQQQQQVLDERQHRRMSSSSSQASARSSAEGAQSLVEEPLQRLKQQKPSCVPLLQLGSRTQAASGTAAGAAGSSHAAGVMPELSWGSDIGAAGLAAGSESGAVGDTHCVDTVDADDALQAADLQAQQQLLLQELRFGSPLRQPVFEEQQGAAANKLAEAVGELSSAAAVEHCSLPTAASWSPKRSIGVHSSEDFAKTGLPEECNSSDAAGSLAGICSPQQADNTQAAAAGGAARQRRAAQTALSRSLDSSMFAAAYANNVLTESIRSISGNSSSTKPPPGGQARNQTQQKLGLRQPWRPAGQGLAASPGGRKWTQHDAQLAQEAAAAAAAAAGRPRSASPAAAAGVKPSVQQQRLDALRLRSKPRTPETSKQQQRQLAGLAGGAAAALQPGSGSSSRGMDTACDQRDRLALLLSSIDSTE
jgi:hypothetical protein